MTEAQRQEAIHALNSIYVAEWRLSYKLFACSESLRQLNDEESAQALEVLSIDDREHAKTILNQVLHLGGTPIGNPMSPSDEPLSVTFDLERTVKEIILEKKQLISKYEDLLENNFEFNSKIDLILYDERDSISVLKKL